MNFIVGGMRQGPRVIALAVMAVGIAACSGETTRFNDSPFPSQQPEANGPVAAARAPVARYEQQPLPPPQGNDGGNPNGYGGNYNGSPNGGYGGNYNGSPNSGNYNNGYGGTQNGSYGSGPDNTQLFVPFSSMERDFPPPEQPGVIRGYVNNIVVAPTRSETCPP